jgi:NADP-dependent 3-hydroxy acid dehydrogenase YdfG
MAKLTGKFALITGAARGIGAETARASVRQGSKLILTDLDGKPLNALAAEIGEERVVARVGGGSHGRFAIA